MLPVSQPAAAAKILEFLATTDLDAFSAEVRASMCTSAARQLKSPNAEVRVAAAQLLAVAGVPGVRTEFVQAITDSERKVRWAVVRRFSEHPQDLENAQLMVLVSFIADSKRDSAVRSDVHALLLAVFATYSRGQKPEGYDPWADPAGQRESLDAWERWARTVVITPR